MLLAFVGTDGVSHALKFSRLSLFYLRHRIATPVQRIWAVPVVDISSAWSDRNNLADHQASADRHGHTCAVHRDYSANRLRHEQRPAASQSLETFEVIYGQPSPHLHRQTLYRQNLAL